MSYRVKLNIFEGPFDLLVYLIEHAQMSIYDIQISEIINQYMGYLEELQREDITFSSEFMVLASVLLEIKSKLLLPRSAPEDVQNEVMEDPRTQLVEKLMEYKLFKRLSSMLGDRFEDAAGNLEKPQEDLAEYTGEDDEYLVLGIDQFKAAFEAFLTRKKKIEEIQEHHIRTEKQRITSEIKMDSIRSFFIENGVKEADFNQLLENNKDRYDIAVTFSSLLEMVKNQKLDAEQRRLYGNIKVKALKVLLEEKESNNVG